MAKAAINNPKKPLPPQEKMLLQESIGEGIPTPEDIPARKPSIIQSKLASGTLSWLEKGERGRETINHAVVVSGRAWDLSCVTQSVSVCLILCTWLRLDVCVVTALCSLCVHRYHPKAVGVYSLSVCTGKSLCSFSCLVVVLLGQQSVCCHWCVAKRQWKWWSMFLRGGGYQLINCLCRSECWLLFDLWKELETCNSLVVMCTKTYLKILKPLRQTRVVRCSKAHIQAVEAFACNCTELLTITSITYDSVSKKSWRLNQLMLACIIAYSHISCHQQSFVNEMRRLVNNYGENIRWLKDI